jgi:RNA polymerase sigma-70 factor (ECF subfamily)
VDGGLSRLDALEASGALPRYHLLPAARADLLARTGRVAPARDAYKRALSLVKNPVEARFLLERLTGLDEKITPAVDPASGRSSGG